VNMIIVFMTQTGHRKQFMFELRTMQNNLQSERPMTILDMYVSNVSNRQ